jgi:tRNA G18 (ribose-2'-O)-methylase SpoU
MSEVATSEEQSHDARLDIKYNVQTHLQGYTKEANKRHSERSALGYAVLVYNLKGDKNTGMIIRTSAIMGASKVFIIGKRQYDARTVVGAKHYIDIVRINGIPDPRELLADYSPIVIEQGGVSLDTVDWRPFINSNNNNKQKPPCFIMGSEDAGVPLSFQRLCAQMPGFLRISIFQHGVLRSMNVATAHSIVVYEYTKALRTAVADRLTLL